MFCRRCSGHHTVDGCLYHCEPWCHGLCVDIAPEDTWSAPSSRVPSLLRHHHFYRVLSLLVPPVPIVPLVPQRTVLSLLGYYHGTRRTHGITSKVNAFPLLKYVQQPNDSIRKNNDQNGTYDPLIGLERERMAFVELSPFAKGARHHFLRAS